MGSITPPARAGTAGGGPPPPQTRPLRRGRPLKRWRWVGIFGEELMACAAIVQIGPARQSFWSLADADGAVLRERTRMLPRRAELGLVHARARGGALRPGRLRIADRGVELDVELDEDGGIEALCAHGRAAVWTRKQAGVPARGTLRLDRGPPRAVRALAVIDDTAGHHARATEWHWSAGVGEGPGGEALAWNLVSGVNDPPAGSERAVWVAGRPSHAAPVEFAPDLSEIRCEDGALLRFRAGGERARRDNLVIVRSDYRASFGTFSGTLPGGIALARGAGVVEHHRARW